MNKYEETGKYPKGQFSDHVGVMLRGLNMGWTHERLTKYLNTRFHEDFKVDAAYRFCMKAFKLADVENMPSYSADESPKLSNVGLQLLETTS